MAFPRLSWLLAHQRIIATNKRGLTRIQECFLKNHRTLEYLDVSRLGGVTDVARSFFLHCVRRLAPLSRAISQSPSVPTRTYA